jgi:hypothetical protein
VENGRELSSAAIQRDLAVCFLYSEQCQIKRTFLHSLVSPLLPITVVSRTEGAPTGTSGWRGTVDDILLALAE